MRKLRTVLFSYYGAYGNLPGIRDALARWSEKLEPVGPVVVGPDPYGFHKDCVVARSCPKLASDTMREADAVWVGGYASVKNTGDFMDFEGYLRGLKRRMLFISGSVFRQDHKKANVVIGKLGFSPVFCIPELMRFRVGFPTTVLYQPHDPVEPLRVPGMPLVVGHSPGIRKKPNCGSQIIVPMLKRLAKHYGFTPLVMTDMTNEQCVQAKRRCDIFIDRLSPDCGGIGKSGIEAIACGCVVVSSMQHSRHEGGYTPPPIVGVDSAADLEDKLVRLVVLESERRKYHELTMAWREQVSLKAFAKRVDDAVGEL